jgi:hypothetical protein
MSPVAVFVHRVAFGTGAATGDGRSGIEYRDMTEQSNRQSDGEDISLPAWLLPVFTETVAVLASLGRRIGKLTLANLTAILALSGLLLYGVGLLRRVAQLHAEGVPTTRGLPLSSLQEYLIQGLSVLVDPNNVQLILTIIILAIAALVSPRILATVRLAVEADPEPHADDEPSHRNANAVDTLVRVSLLRSLANRMLDKAFRLIGFVVVVGGCLIVLFVILLVPLAYWGPAVASVIPLSIFLFLNNLFKFVDLASWRSWSQSHARLAVTWLVVTLILLTCLYTYCDPPPLERATVRTVTMGTLTGRLLGESNGFLYLIGPETTVNPQANLILLPVTGIVSVQVRQGVKRYAKTLPELAGLRFWRLEVEGEKGRIVRSRPSVHR